MKNVYIIHGYNAAPNKNWFMWLSGELDKIGVKSHILALPNPTAPHPKEWLEGMREQVGSVAFSIIKRDLDTKKDSENRVASTKTMWENSYFVGHSLGTIATLHFLQGLECDIANTKIGGFILVSGFYDYVKGLEALDAFIDVPLDSRKIKNLVKNRLVISARDDAIIPTSFSYELAQMLDSEFIQLPSGGHFTETEGCKRVPVVLWELKRFLGSQD